MEIEKAGGPEGQIEKHLENIPACGGKCQSEREKQFSPNPLRISCPGRVVFFLVYGVEVYFKVVPLFCFKKL